MSGLRLRLTALAMAACAAAGVGLVSAQRVARQLDALAVCEAVDARDWEGALARSGESAGGDATARAAAECRCVALLASERGDECVSLLEAVLADPEARDWAPRPALAVHLIQTRRDAGRPEAAAALALRAGRAHPLDADLFYLELQTRGSVEGEARILRELEARVPDGGPAAARMRATLANRHLQRGDPEAALASLGGSPPPGAGDAAGRWFELRGLAHASAGDVEGVRRTYETWRNAGGDRAELAAHYALALSLTGLADPERTPLALLSDALSAAGALPPELEERLVIRSVLTLVSAGRQEEALALYDAGRRRFALEGLRREEIERSATQRRMAASPGGRAPGELAFRIERPEPGDVLLLSPDADAPPDRGFEAHPVPASGRVLVERSVGTAPQRWVRRDREGRTRASGTVSPLPGRQLGVRVDAGLPEPPRVATPSRVAGDGRRRVFVLLLDCADWRITQYLRARGDLPFLDALLEAGFRAVLDSDPPLTAAALESLVWPNRHGGDSFVGFVHQIGTELAGLADVGGNPFEALSWLLPEEDDLFATLGAGDLSVANLLFAHGGRRAGRHGAVTGPDGAHRRVPFATSERDLTPEERRRFPDLALASTDRDAIHVRTIAAELDAAEEIVRDGAIDVLLLRVEPLDVLTHAHFADAVRDGRDDGRGVLFGVYRYLDARLHALHDLLDADDVLVVMSDHGIRTAMEHSRDAIFVATGAGIPTGRADGHPDLRGVPAALAGLLGVDAEWPETGVLPFASARAGR